MHKLTEPEADCPKCGDEHAFSVPRYQALIGAPDGVYGVMVWECGLCGYKLHTEPLDGKAPRPSSIDDGKDRP